MTSDDPGRRPHRVDPHDPLAPERHLRLRRRQPRLAHQAQEQTFQVGVAGRTIEDSVEHPDAAPAGSPQGVEASAQERLGGVPVPQRAADRRRQPLLPDADGAQVDDRPRPTGHQEPADPLLIEPVPGRGSVHDGQTSDGVAVPRHGELYQLIVKPVHAEQARRAVMRDAQGRSHGQRRRHQPTLPGPPHPDRCQQTSPEPLELPPLDVALQ